jgi:ATP-dependent exoDNAse (exonuclease V) beta subunit
LGAEVRAEVADESIAVIRVARPFAEERPRGAGFGSLVHAVLARVPFDAGRPTIADLSAVESRILGLGEADTSAAAALVERVLSHDVVRRAHGAHLRGQCRRETPLTYRLPDGTLLEGVVDLAFQHDDEWTVVDYKTDREIAAVGEVPYRRQVALYASAISNATGLRCHGVILVI